MELTARLRRSVQTTTASQLTKRVCPAAHPPPRALRAPGASRRGGEQTAIRAVAALGLAVAARSACVLGAERSEGPSGCPIPRVPFTMRRGAQRPADQGSRLSERSEFERDPAGREHRRLPAAKRRGRRQQGRLSFGYVSLAKQRKVPRPPGRDPASALNKGAHHDQHKASKSPNGWKTAKL